MRCHFCTGARQAPTRAATGGGREKRRVCPTTDAIPPDPCLNWSPLPSFSPPSARAYSVDRLRWMGCRPAIRLSPSGGEIAERWWASERTGPGIFPTARLGPSSAWAWSRLPNGSRSSVWDVSISHFPPYLPAPSWASCRGASRRWLSFPRSKKPRLRCT